MDRNIEKRFADMHRAEQGFHDQRAKLASVTSHLGRMQLANKGLEIDLSPFHEQADEARSEMGFYRTARTALIAQLEQRKLPEGDYD
jgi:hypothetical protein